MRFVFISQHKRCRGWRIAACQARLEYIARDWWGGESLLVCLSHLMPIPELAFYSGGEG